MAIAESITLAPWSFFLVERMYLDEDQSGPSEKGQETEPSLLRVKVSTEQELNKNIILHNSQFCRLT
jgi:hypothetical protein